MPDKLTEYLNTAGEQIRWRRARPALTAELRTHLLDQRDTYMEDGMPPEAAEEETLRQMGDPVHVGAELDRVHRPRPQWGLLALTLALALTGGTLRVFLTSGWRHAVSPVQTALALLLGAAALLGAYFLDYSLLGRHAKAVYAGALVLGLLSLWLSPARDNTSYYTRYVVLFYPVAYALWLYCWRGARWRGLLAALAGLAPLLAVVLATPYLLGALLLMLTAAVLWVTAARQDWFALGRGATGAATLVIFLVPLGAAWRLLMQWLGNGRLWLAIHPELDPMGRGYQGTIVRKAVEASQWLGTGSLTETAPGSTFDYLVPEAAQDLFPTTVAHQLGRLPLLVLVGIFAALLGWLLVRCLRQRSQLGRMTALAVILPLGLQALCSLLNNLGFMLVSAHFPLVTGNLHTVVDMALIGLVLSVFRQDALPDEKPVPAIDPAPRERRPLISWRDGDLIIALGPKR